MGVWFTPFGFNFALGGGGWCTRENKCRLQTERAVARVKNVLAKFAKLFSDGCALQATVKRCTPWLYMGLCPCCYSGRHQAGHVWYISWKCVSWQCYYYAGFLEELGFIYVWMPCRCFKFWLRPTLRTKTFAKRLAFFDHPCTAFSKHTVFPGIRAVSVHKPRTFPGRRCCNYRVGKFFPSQ